MIIWRGFGLLIGLAGLMGFVVAELITRAITEDEAYYAAHALPKLSGALLAGAFAFVVVKLLAKGNAPRVLIDKESGKEVVVGRGDALFFIPSKYLPAVFVTIGVIVAFVRS